MRTYLTVFHSSEGAKPSEVVERIISVGFKVQKGYYDFVYEWDEHATIEDTIYFADKIHEVLKDMGVMFRMETDTNSD